MTTRGNAWGQATIRGRTLLTGPECYELRKFCSLNVFFPLMSIYLASQLPSAGPRRNSMDCTMMGGKPVHNFVEMNVDILFMTAESRIGVPGLAAYTGKIPAKALHRNFSVPIVLNLGIWTKQIQASQRPCNCDRSPCGAPRVTAHSVPPPTPSPPRHSTLSHGHFSQ